MSGIYIPGMEMPRRCIACPIGFFDNEYDILHCSLTGEEIHRTDFVYKRSENCPLIPVPPHGDLIGRDELIENCMKEDSFLAELLFRKVSNTPVIIPAEEGE